MLTEIQKKALKLITQKLGGNNIPYQVTGGLASIAYGVKRPLYDIDIEVHKEDIPNIRELFKEFIVEDYYHLQDEEFDIWLLTLLINGTEVDISQIEECYYKGKDGKKIRTNADLSKAEFMTIDGIEVPVEDKKELIAYKKILSREVDLVDIKQIS